MGRTRKSQHKNLGKSLMKKGGRQEWAKGNYTEQGQGEGEYGLKSVTQETSYEEFIATAVLADKDFTAEKMNAKFVTLSVSNPMNNDANYLTEAERKLVVVPRRPQWSKDMSAEELDEAEKNAFLTWRRHMAKLQEKDGITPFERNIEVWKQLWRVIERSEIIVQIVDGRNPLLYRCEDLEAYVREMGKTNVLLINKADFLTEKQRFFWSRYFDSIHLPHAFYSATAIDDKLEEEEVIQEGLEDNEDKLESSEDEALEDGKDDELEEIEDEDSEDSEGFEEIENISSASEDDEYLSAEDDYTDVDDDVEDDSEDDLEDDVDNKDGQCSSTAILKRYELINFLKSFKRKTDKTDAIFVVGFCGYPNVGKSSTINSLMASKKTSVSSTPGKTKHFQTLFVEDDLLLCDCPGLVMPSFGGSQGEMVLGGILPIDTLTNYHPAMALLAQRIPRVILEKKYGITLPPKFGHDEILNAYGAIRGFMTVRGLPDASRASRIFLKDYVNGKLLYCHPPVTVDENEFSPLLHSQLVQYVQEESDANSDMQLPKTKIKPPTLKQPNLEGKLDDLFFAPNSSTVHFKGTHQIPSGISPVVSSSSTLSDKPWKKHNNRKKKEKLRRVYRHLDIE